MKKRNLFAGAFATAPESCQSSQITRDRFKGARYTALTAKSGLKAMAAAITSIASIGVGAVLLIGVIYGEASAATVSSIPGDSATSASFTLSNVEVVGILDSFGTNNTIVLQDSTGSVIDYHMPTSVYAAPHVGDVIDVTITNSPYQDGPELTGSTASAFTLVSTGNPAPTYPVLTIPDFLAASSTSGSATQYGESIVTLDNVHFASAPATLLSNTDYTITDGTNTAILYAYKSYSNVGEAGMPTNGLAQLNALGGGTAASLDITGYVSNYYGTSEFYPLSAVAAPEPSSVVLLGAGLLGLLGMMARRRLGK